MYKQVRCEGLLTGSYYRDLTKPPLFVTLLRELRVYTFISVACNTTISSLPQIRDRFSTDEFESGNRVSFFSCVAFLCARSAGGSERPGRVHPVRAHARRLPRHEPLGVNINLEQLMPATLSLANRLAGAVQRLLESASCRLAVFSQCERVPRGLSRPGCTGRL